MITVTVEERSHYNDTNTCADWYVAAHDRSTGHRRRWKVSTGPIDSPEHENAKQVAAALRVYVASRHVRLSECVGLGVLQ